MATLLLFIIGAIGGFFAAIYQKGDPHHAHMGIFMYSGAIASITFVAIVLFALFFEAPWWVIVFGPAAAALTTKALIWISLR
ncbi:MAG: hypothetical protein OSB62_05940 [Alphaproteobacteria bacterium]|nr:hypothetical protein [Alphaproteobacteria bacterium]